MPSCYPDSLPSQGCRQGIFGLKEDVAVSCACLSTNGLLFPEIFTLAALGPQHISTDTQRLSGHIWTSSEPLPLSSLLCFPNSHPRLFTLATPATKKNSLNEKEKSIRKSQLSAKTPLISEKFKEHRSERGCGVFPTPSQQCVRL